MFRGIAVLVSVLALGVGVVPQASGGTAAQPRPRASRASLDYVAIGDSYSSGPFIPSARPDPTNCMRSTNNYPAYVAGYLQVASYRDVTCSAAKTGDLFHGESGRIPGTADAPQLSALTDQTDVVTFGLGVNEFGIFGELFSVCPYVAPSQPGGHPCQSYYTDPDGVDTMMADATQVRAHVDRGLRAVERQAPNAKVYVVGYPQIVPAYGTCAALPLASGDYAWTRSVLDRVNRSMRQAAGDSDATFVNLSRISAGHDICAGSAAWINGSYVDPTRAANYHPFQAGQHAAAQEIYRVVTGNPVPQDGSANAAPPPGSVVLNGS